MQTLTAADDVGNTVATARTLTYGVTFYGTINFATDVDVFRIDYTRQVSIYVNYLDYPGSDHGYKVTLLKADGTPFTVGAATATGAYSSSLSSSETGPQYFTVSARENVVGSYGVRIEYFDAVDVIAPAVPTLSATASSSNPVFSGSAEPGALVTLKYPGGAILGSARADITGHYSYQTSTPIGTGSYNVAASAADAAGNISAFSNPVSFVVGPIAPTIHENTYLGTASAPVNILLLFGVATAGATVQIWNGSSLLGTTTAWADGNWQLLMNGLADGAYDVKAVIPASAGVAAASSQPIHVVRDSVAPAAPTISATKLPGGDGHTYRVFGTAEANSYIHIYVNGEQGGYIMANAAGTWEISMRLGDGKNALTATATDIHFNKSIKSAPLNVDLITDDFSADVLTTGTVAAGGSVKGAIELDGDKDWIKVNLDALTTYRFTLSGAQTGGGTLQWGDTYQDVKLRVWDPLGNNGEGAFAYAGYPANGDPSILYSATRTGVYYLEASATTHTGTYTVSALTFARDDHYSDNARATAVAVGTVVNAGLQTDGDQDAFRFALEAGKTYTMVLTPGAGAAQSRFSTQIGDAAQTMRVSGNGDSNTGLHSAGFVAPTNGFYYLSVYGDYNSIGATYSITMVAAVDDYFASIATSAVLPLNGTVPARIEALGDADWFKVDLVANTSYTFKMTGAGSGYGSMRTFDAAGKYFSNMASGTPTGSMLTWTPSVSGTYFIEASAYGKTGSYTMQAYVSLVDDYASTLTGAGVATAGQPITARLEVPNDADWFKVALKAGYGYTFTTQTEGADWDAYHGLYFDLADAGGRSVASAMYGDGRPTVTFQATVDGDYYLKLSGSSGSVGSYTVNSTISAKDEYLATVNTTGRLAPGGMIKSAIDLGIDVDWIRVELEAGQTYKFEATGVKGQGGTLATPTLRVSDGIAYGYEYSSGGGRGGDPLVTFTPTKTGAYYVQVAGSNGVGSYTLKMGSAAIGLLDTAAPVLSYVDMPVYAYGEGTGANLQFVFDEKVVLGNGQVRLMLADGTLVESFDMASSTRVTVDANGTRLLVDPTANLAYATGYKVEIGAGAVKDLAGLSLATASTHSFQTAYEVFNLTGTSANDTFTSGRGNDNFNGGAGTDTVIFPELAFKDYRIEKYEGGLYVQLQSGSASADFVRNIERLAFSDQTIAYDVNGAAGQVYRLYQAAFERVPDKAGLGFWIGQVDAGVSLKAVASGFIASAEFETAYGANLSHAAYLAALYDNVLHRVPDAGGLDFWVGAMQSGVTREEVLVSFSESTENQAALIGVLSKGIAYLP